MENNNLNYENIDYHFDCRGGIMRLDIVVELLRSQERPERKGGCIMIQIARIEAISLQETIDMDIDFDGIVYRFRVIVSETPKRKTVLDIEFRDKYELKIQPSVEKKIRKFIKQYFENEND